MMRLCLLHTFVLCAVYLALTLPGISHGQSVTTFSNPLDPQLADPHVIRHQGTYYVYATTDGSRGFGVWSSPDLVNWQWRGWSFEKTASTWAQDEIWAPCVVEHAGRFYMFFNARNNPAVGHRICLAIADTPLGPFREHRAPLWDPGFAMIDAHCFIDRDGSAYLYYSRDISQFPVSETWVVPLSRDLLSVAGQPTLCVTPDKEWEGKWNEAPYVFRWGNRYVMFYSGPGYAYPTYSVGVATANSPLGPWTKDPFNPLMTRTPRVSGPGHPSIIASPDDRELFIVYHTHMQLAGGGERQLAIDRLRLTTGPDGALRIEADGPTTTSQPLPSGVRPFPAAVSDEFNANQLDRTRWQIVNEDPSRWRLASGKLVISTQDGDLWKTRGDVRNMFLQWAPNEDFEIILRPEFRPQRNFDQAFLIIYQDHNNYVRFSNGWIDTRRWQVAHQVDGEFRDFITPNTLGDVCWMKMVRRGRSISCYASLDGQRWYAVGGSYLADFSEVRVGFGASTPGSGRRTDVAFDFFRVQRPEPPRLLGTPDRPAGPPVGPQPR